MRLSKICTAMFIILEIPTNYFDDPTIMQKFRKNLDKQCCKFWHSSNKLNVPHNYFGNPTKLFVGLYVV